MEQIRIKKSLALLLAGMIVLSVITACGSNRKESEKESDKKVILKILRYVPQQLDYEFEQVVIRQFEQLHQGVEIDYQQVKFDSYVSTLQRGLASGDAPDIYLVETGYLKDYVDKGYVADLSDLECVEGIEDKSLESLRVDGKLYAVGTNDTTVCAIYNKKVFADAGITKIPETVDAFHDACGRLVQSGTVPIANGFQEAWTISGNLQADYINGVLEKDPEAIENVCSGKTKFSDSELWKAEFTRFFERYKFSQNHALDTSWDEACAMLADGRAGMILNGSWTITNVLGVNPKALLGVFPVPVSNDQAESKLPLQGAKGGWAVYKNSRNMELAKEFVDYISSAEVVSQGNQMRQAFSNVKDAASGDDPAIQDIQRYIDEGRVFYQGSLDHNFPNAQRNVLEKTIAAFLADGNDDVDALCRTLDEKFADISE